MKTNVLEILPADIDSLIVEVRGQKVILDSDLACIYGVPTRRLNEQVKRNARRFPQDFLFRLTNEEMEQCQRLRSQFVTLKRRRSVEGRATGAKGQQMASGLPGPILKSQFATSSFTHGGRRKLPYAFTEHGSIMAANVLNSPRAVDMSVFVVRAFVKMRSAFKDNRQLAQKLALLEHELKTRLDVHEVAIVEILQRIMKILDPPPPPPEPPTPEIGFHVKEDAVPYRIRRKAAQR
jgi:hypothetical protein